MKTTTAICAAVALSLASSGLAFGQNRDDHRDDRRGNDHRQDARHDEARRDFHEYHRGDRLRPQDHQRQYVVDDWRGHHLRQPPRGYHWVQNGGDYVLAAIATGVIADLLLSHR
jgi:Ni/Co efflux regulator RcnB